MTFLYRQSCYPPVDTVLLISSLCLLPQPRHPHPRPYCTVTCNTVLTKSALFPVFEGETFSLHHSQDVSCRLLGRWSFQVDNPFSSWFAKECVYVCLNHKWVLNFVNFSAPFNFFGKTVEYNLHAVIFAFLKHIIQFLVYLKGFLQLLR